MPYLQAQSAGDLNVVAVGWTDTTSTIISVTDSAGNVYQLAAPLTRGSAMSQAIYYAKDINAATAGTNVVTVQFSAAVPYADVRAAEYSGIDPVDPLDTSAVRDREWCDGEQRQPYDNRPERSDLRRRHDHGLVHGR